MSPIYLRKRNVIRGPDGDEVFKSVALAKKQSFKLQQLNGGLGRGSLRVVDKFPKEENDA